MADDSQPPERPVPADPVVEYCLGNVTNRARTALSESDLRTEATACLGRCGDCFAEPFLVVDGAYVPGRHDELIDSLGGDA